MEIQTYVRAISAIVAALLAGLGVLCLLRPGAVQSYVLRTVSGSQAERIHPFRHWMQRPSYVTYLRIMDVLVLLFAGVLAFAAIISG